MHITGQRISAEKIYVHEQYDNKVIRNDMTIIYLSESVQVTNKVNFICLPGPEADIGGKAYVTKKRQISALSQ